MRHGTAVNAVFDLLGVTRTISRPCSASPCPDPSMLLAGHRAIAADVVPSLLDRWPDIPATEETARAHAVYGLGPRLPLAEPIPNGASYRASRLWVLLDQLQTSPTLAGALTGSNASRPVTDRPKSAVPKAIPPGIPSPVAAPPRRHCPEPHPTAGETLARHYHPVADDVDRPWADGGINRRTWAATGCPPSRGHWPAP